MSVRSLETVIVFIAELTYWVCPVLEGAGRDYERFYLGVAFVSSSQTVSPTKNAEDTGTSVTGVR